MDLLHGDRLHFPITADNTCVNRFDEASIALVTRVNEHTCLQDIENAAIAGLPPEANGFLH